MASKSNFKPYLGVGLGYVQEIDLDGIGDSQNSYSQKNEFAYQLIAGSDYKIDNNFSLMADLRYLKSENITLEQEGGSAEIKDIDYDPITLTIGLKYQF